MDSPYSPVASNNPLTRLLAFDDYKNNFAGDTPLLLQGKEDQLPNFLTSIY
jgi:hypothetical protein